MKLIDAINMMTEGKIKEGTKLIIVTPNGREYEYKYDVYINNDNWSFVDDYDRSISYMFDITVDTLQYEVRLIEQKEKKYLVKFNMRGLQENEMYLNYQTKNDYVFIYTTQQSLVYKTHFTKSELKSIKSVKEFLEDMEGKYELIGVDEDETN